jgi:hypothetical protein
MHSEPKAQPEAGPEPTISAKGPKLKGRSLVRTVVFVGLGALAGFLYAHFIGCKTGACPLTSNVYTAALYGAVIGFLAGGF